AELEGLVRAAVSNAYTEYISAGEKVEVKNEIMQAVVTNKNFQEALENDIRPAFGAASLEKLKQIVSLELIEFSNTIKENLNKAEMICEKSLVSRHLRMTSVLVHGNPKSGTSAFAAHIALNSRYFIRKSKFSISVIFFY
ncbi:MAG: transport between ER and Golgi ATPase protein, partial [Paramarteilia canceri]